MIGNLSNWHWTGAAGAKTPVKFQMDWTIVSPNNATGRLHRIWWWDLLLHINSLGPGDTVWQQIFVSTLAQVMAYCLIAPSHYLNQCWFITSDVLWHSTQGNFTGNAQDICPWCKFENYKLRLNLHILGYNELNGPLCFCGLAKYTHEHIGYVKPPPVLLAHTCHIYSLWVKFKHLISDLFKSTNKW